MSKQAKKKKAEFNKAGCVVMGLGGPDSKGDMSLLVPYNEGRFSQNGEYFVLPKGSIDPGEEVLDAAIRETSEETGIDIRKLLGDAAIEQLRAGKPVRHLKSEGYPGVTILKADPVPFRHRYLSRAGVEHHLAMFKIEVEGIDILANHTDIKNHGQTKTSELIDDYPSANRDSGKPVRPKFPEFMRWMQQGYIPADAPNLHPDIDGNDVEHGVVPLHTVKWFNQLEKKYAPDGQIVIRNEATGKTDWEETRTRWQTFCKNLSPSDYKQLTRSFSAIKTHLKERGWVGGDTDLLKFDEKDCPLFYYTEGAHVVPVQEYLSKIFYDLEHNADYACAFGGQCDVTKQFSPHRTITHSQLAAIGPFVETYDYVNALHKTIEQNGGKPLTWQKQDCEPCQEQDNKPQNQVKAGDNVIQALINTRAKEVVRHGTERVVAGAFRA